MSKKGKEISEFEMDLNNFFCLRSNLSNDNIISGYKRPGLKTGMDFRVLVWKRVWKIKFLSEIGSGSEEPGGTPASRILKSTPPPPPPGILARGKLDTHYKIKETLLIRDLKPALSLSQNGWVTLGSPCPLNVGVQDWWRTVINNFDRVEGRRLICRPVKSDGLLVRWASIVFRERFYSSELSSLDITT